MRTGSGQPSRGERQREADDEETRQMMQADEQRVEPEREGGSELRAGECECSRGRPTYRASQRAKRRVASAISSGARAKHMRR